MPMSSSLWKRGNQIILPPGFNQNLTDSAEFFPAIGRRAGGEPAGRAHFNPYFFRRRP